MAHFLGLDGGGSGCRAAVADAAGRVLGRGTAGPANIVTDPEGARAAVMVAAGAAAAEAGVALADVAAVLGLAGANIPEAAAQLAAALPFPARIESDALIAVKGALGDDDGIVAILGTGSVFAAQRGGRMRTIGGWGLVLGDEGGGAWIGRALLSRALHARDGLVDDTPFLATLRDGFGGAEGIVAFARNARPADFAALAPRALAAAPDPGAEAVMAAASDWIARFLRGLDPGLPIALMGGAAGAFADRLPADLAARLVAPRGSALDGALWMARQAGAR